MERKEHVEFDLLCAVARPKPDHRLAATILERRIDWPVLLRLAASHGVRPQLLRAFRERGWEGVPADVKSALETFQRSHQVQTLSLVGEIDRIADAFSKRGIAFVAFKGASLAATLYGDVSQREFHDIDLIVPKSRMEEAERLLLSAGYTSMQGDLAFRQKFCGYQRQYQYLLEEPQIVVDLHWAFTSTHLPFPLPPADVWNDRSTFSIGGRAVPTVSGCNLALLLAGHGTKEAWRRLAWVCDFALCVERHPDLDWLDIFSRARQQGCGTAVLAGCALAEELLAVPVPKALSSLIGGSGRIPSRIQSVAQSTARRLREAASTEMAEGAFVDLDLCDTWRDKAIVMARLFLTPTDGDFQALPLPSALWPLYHLTRPFRLAIKALSMLRKGRPFKAAPVPSA